jgi:pyruvate dehydrogenase E1 component alpha subunit
LARTAKTSSPAKTAAPPAPPADNRERPAEPTRFAASKEQLLDFYKQMLLIRRFEERAGQLYGLGLIGGFCHLYIGQEAVAVGLQSAMTVGTDSVITGYRDHGHMLAYGIDPTIIMAELTGRDSRSMASTAATASLRRRSGWAPGWPLNTSIAATAACA